MKSPPRVAAGGARGGAELLRRREGAAAAEAILKDLDRRASVSTVFKNVLDEGGVKFNHEILS